MAQKSVAKEGDVTATAGSGVFPPAPALPATTGAWSAGPVTLTSYAFFTIGGVAVVHAASCTFTYPASTDSTPSPTPVGTSLVTLTASATTLQKGSTFVLRDGDEASDSYGNKVGVGAANNLTSD